MHPPRVAIVLGVHLVCIIPGNRNTYWGPLLLYCSLDAHTFDNVGRRCLSFSMQYKGGCDVQSQASMVARTLAQPSHKHAAWHWWGPEAMGQVYIFHTPLEYILRLLLAP